LRVAAAFVLSFSWVAVRRNHAPIRPGPFRRSSRAFFDKHGQPHAVPNTDNAFATSRKPNLIFFTDPAARPAIVDAKRGRPNQPIDFLKPHLAGIVMFQ